MPVKRIRRTNRSHIQLSPIPIRTRFDIGFYTSQQTVKRFTRIDRVRFLLLLISCSRVSHGNDWRRRRRHHPSAELARVRGSSLIIHWTGWYAGLSSFPNRSLAFILIYFICEGISWMYACRPFGINYFPKAARSSTNTPRSHHNQWFAATVASGCNYVTTLISWKT